MRVKVYYRNVKEVVPPPPLGSRPMPMNIDYVDWDIHEVDDLHCVTRDAYGYLTVTATDEGVFLYPTTNLVKVEVV